MSTMRLAAGAALLVAAVAASLPALAAGPAGDPAVAPPGVIFPTSIDPRFADEKPWLARLHTCSAQYRIEKARNALNGLTWYKGYYSLCNKQLKKVAKGGA